MERCEPTVGDDCIRYDHESPPERSDRRGILTSKWRLWRTQLGRKLAGMHADRLFDEPGEWADLRRARERRAERHGLSGFGNRSGGVFPWNNLAGVGNAQRRLLRAHVEQS